jgi:hypothetical protein
MSNIRLTVASLVGILAVGASLSATSIERTNYLTFSAPFALPGVSLPAGTYAFQVVAPGSHDVVRVSSRDGARVYLLAFTNPVDRPNGLRRDYQIVFNEAQAGMAPPVKAWFPIGENVGHEFVYPASRTSR